MSYEDIPKINIPMPINLEAFKRPVIITEDCYNKLSETEKIQYEKINE